ncbi:methyltransferase [Paenibacillus sp. EKM208P]|nr:methyltransferase [Paenibacillus sp. EKM208P]
MANLNLSYYNSSADELYSDGDIENELLEYAKKSSYDWYNDKRWPIVYHLSPLRHNILNWFPFSSDCTILEIGAGCGALTGLLCEHASRVVAIELTKRRAEINYERHRHYDNLEILVCDFQKVPEDLKFDYIIINGVLEYAAYMFESSNPYQAFLQKASKHLNQNGKMLLAIENRLGLKYFAGSREDHTGQFFSGLNNYSAGEKVRTFSKSELTELVNDTGLHALKFYYPYPDYKFPFEIFTDETIHTMQPAALNQPLDMPRMKLFDESSVYRSFMNMRLMDEFSNSFLVEIAASPEVSKVNISYIKISNNRAKKFGIFTGIDSSQTMVFKKALYTEGRAHLQHMFQFNQFKYNEQSDIQNIQSYQENDSISFPYITGQTLEKLFLDSLAAEGQVGFIDHFIRFQSKLMNGIEPAVQRTTKEFQHTFGLSQPQQELHWAYNTNLDIIASNIFVKNGKYNVIDYEWHFENCMIPVEFSLWRMLKQFANDHMLQSILTADVVLELLQINEYTESCFVEWEQNFAQSFVGIKDLSHLAQATVSVDMDKVINGVLNESKLESTLFYDLNNGFSDEHYERKTANYVEDGFEVTFLAEHLQCSNALRWDPLEGKLCNIKIKNIETDGSVTEIVPLNADSQTDEGGYCFLTYDPQFLIQGDFTGATYIKIRFSCEILEWTEGYILKEQQLELCNKQLVDVKNELKDAQNKLNHTQSELNHMQSELNHTQGELEHTKQLFDDNRVSMEKITNELTETTENLRHTQAELANIHAQIKNQRIKTILKVLLFGSVNRRKNSG